MIIDLKNRKLFNEIYIPLLNEKKRYILLYGGRDSAKSYFAAQKVIIDTMRKPYSRYILVRKSYTQIKDSQFQTIKDIIKSYGLMDYFHFTENPLRIVFIKNGNMILARGMDKDHKTKSIKDPTGIWYEEMNEIAFTDFMKTTTSLRGGVIQEIGTFNPEMETEWINEYFFPVKESYERRDGNFHYIKSVKNDAVILHTTYKDNQYVTSQSIKLLESFKETNRKYYDIFTLGLWGGVLEGLIFKNWKVVETKKSGIPFVGYGLDWGYTNDPTALIKVYIGESEIYVREKLYRKGMSNKEIATEMKEAGIKSGDLVVADSAEPKSIQEIYQYGFNIQPVYDKSIKAGISKMNNYRILVDSKSQNIIRELQNYRWKYDKNNIALNVPIDNYNHAIDSIRYVLMNYFMPRRSRMHSVKTISK